MSKHTPGPWIVEKDHKTPIYVSPKNRYEDVSICNVLTIDEDDSESGDFLNGEQTKANARLIAAAPDLLEALELVIDEMAPAYHDCTDDGLQECAWCIARTTIAKARGDQ